MKTNQNKNTPLSDTSVVSLSFLVSVSDIVLNTVIGVFTGSAILLSQALQGLSDVVTAGILLFGVERSKRSADERHPFGYGREIFFWVLIAGIIMFLVTGCLSIYLGLQKFRHPEPIEHTWLVFGLLVFGFSTNFYSFSRSAKRLNQAIGAEHWWERLKGSSIVETQATFLIDFLGTAAAVTGLVSLTAYALTGNARFDGLGAILVGVGMAVGSLLLINNVKGLIVGKSVPDSLTKKIKRAALGVPGVLEVLDLRTMYMGSARLLVVIELHLDDKLSTSHIEHLSDQVKEAIQKKVPHAYHIQVEVETPDDEL